MTILPNTLSLCMIARNEEANLARCLTSVRDVADEIIFVDTGSTDNTIAIAQQADARIFVHPWQNNFALARNFGLQEASGEWILFLDADEVLAPESKAILRSIVFSMKTDAGRLRIRNLLPNSDLFSYEECRITRLFRNHPEHRFEQAIHEQILPSITRRGGRVSDVDLTILHYGYQQRTAQDGQDRMQRNLAIIEQELLLKPKDAYLLLQKGILLKSLGQNELAYDHLKMVLTEYNRFLSRELQELLFMKLAQLALSSGDNQASKGYARSCLTLNPDNGTAVYCLAVAAITLGELSLACRLFQDLYQGRWGVVSARQELEVLLRHCTKTLKKE